MRIHVLLLAGVALLAPLPAAAAAPDESGTIVVTGRSLQETGRALAECIARHCPPAEDIAATLAHAENQFVAGDYRDARATLNRSLGRNRRHGGELPVEVASLYRATGRIAAHLGQADEYRSATLEMRDTLKDTLGKEDPRTLAADIEVGDSRLKLGFPEDALDIYARTERRAEAAGLRAVAAMARIRTASLLSQMAAESRDELAIRRADAALAALRADARPNEGSYALAAEVLRARLDRELGRPDRTAELIAAARSLGTDRPVLLYAKPIELRDTSVRTGAGEQPVGGEAESLYRNVLSRIASTNYEGVYVDIGFSIDADGHVRDAEVLRSSGADARWLKPVLASLGSRVYVPLRRTPDNPDPSLYRVERYTLTSELVTLTGSRIAQHGAQPYVVQLDLTAEPG